VPVASSLALKYITQLTNAFLEAHANDVFQNMNIGFIDVREHHESLLIVLRTDKERPVCAPNVGLAPVAVDPFVFPYEFVLDQYHTLVVDQNSGELRMLEIII
jgi:hypothetical protein